MIKIENFEVTGWENAIRGMRNHINSWDESDSCFLVYNVPLCDYCSDKECDARYDDHKNCKLGPNDRDLIMNYRKCMRMITVYADITAPLYWWNDYDKYEVDSSCSTIDNIMDKEFILDDFSHEHLFGPDDMRPYDERRDLAEDKALAAIDVDGNICYYTPIGYMKMTCDILNYYRNKYLEAKSKSAEEAMKKYWWQVIQLLPSSYNQKRTVMLNYEVLANMYHDGKNINLMNGQRFVNGLRDCLIARL